MAELQVYKCLMGLNVPDGSLTGKADDESHLLNQLSCPLHTSIAFLYIGLRVGRPLTWKLRAPSVTVNKDGSCIAIFDLA